MKRPRTAPTALNRRFRSIGTTRTRESNAETVAKKPNTSSAHTPTDIGDQYLKFKPVWPGVTSMSMCQNRGRLVARVSRQAEQRRQHVGAAREPREKEVEEDVPRPLRGANEMLGEKNHQPVTRRLNATRPATTATTPVTSAVR